MVTCRGPTSTELVGAKPFQAPSPHPTQAWPPPGPGPAPPPPPGVALAGHRLADRRVPPGVQVPGDVAGGQAERPQQADGDVRDVLADALARGDAEDNIVSDRLA